MISVCYRDAAGRIGRRLLAEYLDALQRAQSPPAREWRDRMGWPRAATLMGLGGAIARIEPSADGRTYQPTSEGGQLAIIIPCWAGPAPGQPGDLVDLVAWIPSDGRLLTRRGVADLIGEAAVWAAEHPLGDGHPLAVYPDPLSWARAAMWGGGGAHGIVVVDWGRAWARLGHLEVLMAADVATARRLREALTPPRPRPPRILITASSSEAA